MDLSHQVPKTRLWLAFAPGGQASQGGRGGNQEGHPQGSNPGRRGGGALSRKDSAGPRAGRQFLGRYRYGRQPRHRDAGRPPSTWPVAPPAIPGPSPGRREIWPRQSPLLRSRRAWRRCGGWSKDMAMRSPAPMCGLPIATPCKPPSMRAVKQQRWNASEPWSPARPAMRGASARCSLPS